MEKKHRRRILYIIEDIFIVVGLIAAGVLWGSAWYYDNYPYEYNYYVTKYLDGVDLKQITIKKYSDYYRDYDYKFVQNTKYLYAENKQDLINIMYTLINSGQKKTDFYCAKEYKDCKKDAEELVYAEENNIISRLNVFTHPYNDYKTMSCGVNEYTGEGVFSVSRKYDKDKIAAVNAEVDRLYNELVDPNDTLINNITKIHDYLVNTIEYDKVKSKFIEKESDVDSIYDSTTAYGALIEHQAVCGGYTAAMYLFLDKLGVQSMRVSTYSHIWNLVYIDGQWLHLDVTWDDGKYTNGKSFLSHKYFLIDSETLLSLDTKSHSFDTNMYLELS